MSYGRMYRVAAITVIAAVPAVGACASMGNESMIIAQPAPAAVQSMVADWPNVSRMAADAMMQKYGEPDEATPTMLVWHDNGPWKRTIVYREEIQHNFPIPHKDVLEQFVNYDVPPETFDDLAMYDGSVIAERTKGEISARCDKEAANILALNLAHEIIEGERTVEDARRMYAAQMTAKMNNQPAPYTERLMFSPPANVNNPDHPPL